MEHDSAAVAEALRALGRPEGLLSPLRAYAAAVERDADRLGLVSEAGLDRFLVRHVAESLLFGLVTAPKPGAAWADVGSGAGLPGIPLAIAYPEASFTLIEPQQRRAGFLELVIEDLGLSNVTVVARRAQNVRERFDVVVTRAFSSDAASGADEATRALLSGLLLPAGIAVIEIAEDADAPDGVEVREVPLESVDLRVRFLSMTAG